MRIHQCFRIMYTIVSISCDKTQMVKTDQRWIKSKGVFTKKRAKASVLDRSPGRSSVF